MSNANDISLNDKWLRLFGIPISVLLLLLVQMPFYFPGRWDLFWRYVFISIIFTSLMWEIARLIMLRVRRRYTELGQTTRRIIVIFLCLAVQMGIGQAILSKLMLDFRWSETTEPYWKVWLVNFASSLFFIALLCGIYEAIYFFSQYKFALQKAEHLKIQQAQQRLDTLKTRVNPHFLFNSLTTLSALIGEDALKAERFVDELSKVYRYMLRAARQPVATLGEELQFAESYTFLLKNRFEEGAFSLETKSGSNVPAPLAKLPPDFDRSIPTLSFQNAIDYLIRTQNLPLKIEVKLVENHLQIACANQPKTIAFDMPDNDWRQLEAHGARLETGADQLKILIPFTQNNPATCRKK
jgi:hypothetical protein